MIIRDGTAKEQLEVTETVKKTVVLHKGHDYTKGQNLEKDTSWGPIDWLISGIGFLILLGVGAFALFVLMLIIVESWPTLRLFFITLTVLAALALLFESDVWRRAGSGGGGDGRGDSDLDVVATFKSAIRRSILTGFSCFGIAGFASVIIYLVSPTFAAIFFGLCAVSFSIAMASIGRDLLWFRTARADLELLGARKFC